MEDNEFYDISKKYNVNVNSMRSIKRFLNNLPESIDDMWNEDISFIFNMLSRVRKEFGNEPLYEFEYIVNEEHNLFFKLFYRTIFNMESYDNFKNSYFKRINEILGDGLDSFTIANNSYFREMSDDECSSLVEDLRNDFSNLVFKPLYDTESYSVVYQLNGIDLDSLIESEFIDFTLLKNNVYREEFNLKFNKGEFSDFMDEVERAMSDTRNVFIHSSDIYSYLIDFEYDNNGDLSRAPECDFEDDEVFTRSFDESRFQRLVFDTISKLTDVDTNNILGSDRDYVFDMDSIGSNSKIVSRLQKFIQKEIGVFVDKVSDKFFGNDIELADDSLRIDYEIVESDAIQTSKQFVLVLLTMINIHTMLHMNTNGYKSRRFILRSLLYKLHLLGVELVDYGSCVFEPKMKYRPFDWSDR